MLYRLYISEITDTDTRNNDQYQFDYRCINSSICMYSGVMCDPLSQKGRGEVTDAVKVEYRVWNPFRSKLAAAILGGVDQIYIKPGSKVLYLGAASGTTVSHVSDIVGPVSWYK